MHNEKKRVLRFIKGLPTESTQEEIIKELIMKDLWERGVTPEQFEKEKKQIEEILDGPDFRVKQFFS
jgi:hypothetical protein